MNDRQSRASGATLILGSALSSQTGAAVGAIAFPVIGPVGVVAIRQWVAAVLLFVVARPRLRQFGREQWAPVVGLASVFAVMNLSVYLAIDRIGLGLAITLEFLGPFAVALMGAVHAAPAGTRRRLIICCLALARGGVLTLTRPQPSADYVGICLGLLAAACWGAYILLNRTMGERFRSVEGVAAAGMLSALAYVPIGLGALILHPPTAAALLLGTVAGLLSSAVPFVADNAALRRVPTYFRYDGFVRRLVIPADAGAIARTA